MITSYTEIKRLLEQRKNNPLYNTSYPLSPDDWAKYSTSGLLPFDFSKPIAIYLHIPFCRQICSFCEYTKMCVPEKVKQRHYIASLMDDVERFFKQNSEMKLYGLDIGGGTPTSLDPEVFGDFMTWIGYIMNDNNIINGFEPSIEGSFETLVSDDWGPYKSACIAKSGVKRLSLGVQSTSDKVLKPLSRNAISINDMSKAIDNWHFIGISKINVDLMYGLPGQTVDTIRKDVEVIRDLNPEQVTVYEFRTNQLKTSYKTNSDTCFEQYCELYNGLISLGYYGEFGRNTFSRDSTDYGLSSYLRHRMFDGWQYKGFGVSAQSMSKFGVSYNLGKNEVVSKMIDPDWFVKHKYSYESARYYKLSREEILSKFIAISGYSGGFSLSAAKELFGIDFSVRYQSTIDFLINENLATIKGERIQLTESGFHNYGAVLSLFYL